MQMNIRVHVYPASLGLPKPELGELLFKGQRDELIKQRTRAITQPWERKREGERKINNKRLILQKPVSLQLAEALEISTYDVTQLLTRIMNRQKKFSSWVQVFISLFTYSARNRRCCESLIKMMPSQNIRLSPKDTDLWMIIKCSVEERAGEVTVSQMYTHALTDTHRHLLITFGPAIHSYVCVDFLSAFSP